MENYVELEQPINTSDISIINYIDTKISKAYEGYKELFDFLTLLHVTKKDAFDIMQLTNLHCQKMNTPLHNTLIDALCKKNIFFNEAINYFSTSVHKNIDQVTYKTIDIVDNPTAEQPSPEFNNIPQEIREYIMQKVHDEIDLWYEIPLPHPDAVHRFAIHPATDRAITYSFDYQLRVWDLTTASIFFTCMGDNAIDLVQFNENGSLFATASRYRTYNSDEISYIKIYDLIAQKLLLTMQHDARVYHVKFIKNSPLQLTTFGKKKIDGYKHAIVTLWHLNTKKPSTYDSKISPWQGKNFNFFASDKYAGYVDDDENTVRIIKKKCAPLYICKQAIKNNTDVNTLDTIPRSQQYHQLTQYEKQLISTKIEQEKSWLKNSPMILALARK
jgi:WD40 repeat protein